MQQRKKMWQNIMWIIVNLKMRGLRKRTTVSSFNEGYDDMYSYTYSRWYFARGLVYISYCHNTIYSFY